MAPKAILLLSIFALSVCVAADVLFHLQHPLGASKEQPQIPESDPAGRPNLASRLEITASGTQVICGRPGDAYTAGYAHFTNNDGEEDKHMFWWLFRARYDWENAPVVLSLSGGPGASGMLFPFGGAGPCIVNLTEDGHDHAVPSPFSWTEHVNLLAVDHPVDVGYSYGEQSSLRNSSATTAWDVDDFLQLFWSKFPSLVKNTFTINSGSYGGTYVPHVVNTIRSRNLQRTSRSSSQNRIIKMPDSLILGNTWSDVLTSVRWFHASNCVASPDSNQFFNSTICADLLLKIPQCLDSVQLAYEQPTLEYQLQAMESLGTVLGAFSLFLDRDPYDARHKCSLPEECSVQATLDRVGKALDTPKMKEFLGVSTSRPFWIFNNDVSARFILNGDMIQPAYRLLAPAIEDGLRVLVYNGMADGMCPWRSNLAWMRLLKTQHQVSFWNASEIDIPGVGSMIQADGNAFTFIKIRDAGHMLVGAQPELFRYLMKRWIANETLF